jgi:hypothetical protein
MPESKVCAFSPVVGPRREVAEESSVSLRLHRGDGNGQRQKEDDGRTFLHHNDRDKPNEQEENIFLKK